MVRVEGLAKVYPAIAEDGRNSSGRGEVVLFRGLNFTVGAGEMVAIVGESGSGKSSLLHLLAALDRPTAGEVWVGGTRVGGLTTRQGAEFRNREVGYVWQFHYLLPEFTAVENVAMPLLARGERRGEALGRALDWLREVGLESRAGHRSGELSGGEQQRVSLASALVTGPKLLLADEPTGDLDERTAETVFALIQRLHREHNLTSVLVTHSMPASRGDASACAAAEGWPAGRSAVPRLKRINVHGVFCSRNLYSLEKSRANWRKGVSFGYPLR